MRARIIQLKRLEGKISEIMNEIETLHLDRDMVLRFEQIKILEAILKDLTIYRKKKEEERYQ